MIDTVAAPYYDQDGITIYHGDCREILPLLPSCALALTDPPFNEVNERDDRGDFRKLNKGSADDAPVDVEWLSDALAASCETAYVFAGAEQFSTYVRAFRRNGMTVRSAFWQKTNPSPFNGEHFWLSAIELCVFARRAGATFTRHCSPPVWVGPTIRDPRHPTPKPEWLIAELILASTRPGDLVIDPYVGGGTTLSVAKRLGRVGIGIEIDRGYCQLAADRVAQQALPFMPDDWTGDDVEREVPNMAHEIRIDDHSRWSDLILPHLYCNGSGPGGHGRNERIEVRDPASARDRADLLKVNVQCVCCGRYIRPIRERRPVETAGSLYLSVSCEQAARPGCSRTSSRTSVEVQRIIALVGGYADPRQPRLFGDLDEIDTYANVDLSLDVNNPQEG